MSSLALIECPTCREQTRMYPLYVAAQIVEQGVCPAHGPFDSEPEQSVDAYFVVRVTTYGHPKETVERVWAKLQDLLSLHFGETNVFPVDMGRFK